MGDARKAREAESPAGSALRVECYSGHKADQRPVRLYLRGQELEVTIVEDRWYSPGFTLFRVLLSDGSRYLLRHQEAQDRWTIEGFRGPSGRSECGPAR